ncbi:MAG: hypothetical protein AUK51_13175 [Comamonadaceae bacterium CG2_30_59_20]|nr:MAG: hypothetical protein AUK51_13175 [Comamonadaceae bacterium CG2_30_59_20]
MMAAADISESNLADLRLGEALGSTVFDAMVESMAVLDAQGVIVAVNQRWHEYAQANGATTAVNRAVGLNYLALCDCVVGQAQAQEAGPVAAGIRAVLNGEKQDFHLEYPCHAVDQSHWFHLHVSPLRGSLAGVLVAHEDITQRVLAQQAVLESEQRYRMLFEMSGDAIMLTAPDGHVFDANPAACRMFQRSREELCQLGRNGVVDTSEAHLAVALKVRQQTGHFAGETTFLRKDGSKLIGEVSSTVFTDKDGNARTSMVIRDVSERKRMEAALKDNEQRMSAVFQASPIGIVISRIKTGEILDVNEACLRLYGYTREQALGYTAAELGAYVYPEQRLRLVQLLNEQGYANASAVDYRSHTGEHGVLEVSARRISIQGESCLLAMMMDVTERHQSEALMHEQAFHDPLTRLPNRRLLGDRLRQTMATARRNGYFGALIYLDLDNFKPLNDTHGHDMGDLLLVEVAKRLSQVVRAMDTVARVGGDEFVILLDELDTTLVAARAQALAVAEKVRDKLDRPYQLTVHSDGFADRIIEHNCSASLGIVLFANDDTTDKELLSWADAAMYQAKHNGRNQIHLYQTPA